jgi:hypothetical protein
MAGEQSGRGVGHSHRHPGMARIGLFDGIHRQRSDRVGKSALGRLHAWSFSVQASAWVSRSAIVEARPSALVPIVGEAFVVNC